MILIDANPLIALADCNDELYEKVLTDLKRLQRQPFFCTSTVMVETFFAFQDAQGRKKVQQLIEGMRIQPVPEDRQLWNEIFQWLAKYAHHRPDWTDAHLAVLCGRQKRFRVWTYDEKFRKIWRRPDGSRIPLAV